jgi:hypothetical protein
MEDISRELEKEIAQSKPSPYKKSKRKRVLIIDDFGEIKSAGHLKVLVNVFFVTSLVCFFAATGLYYLFSNQTLEKKRLESKLAGLEEKVDHLTNEKEVLMARLVISGKEPGIESSTTSAVPSISTAKETTEKEKKAGIKEKTDPKSVNTVSKEIAATTAKKPPPVVGIIAAGQTQKMALAPVIKSKEPVAQVQQMVAIEKFSVTRDGAEGDLLVRFDIRNISDKPGGVSGRIFTILKPENRPQEEWLVVPAATLNNGVPVQHKRGQYFSIEHFKPVKFRIENQAGPDFFKKSAIYIFNENGDLMFESLIDITEEESS